MHKTSMTSNLELVRLDNFFGYLLPFWVGSFGFGGHALVATVAIGLSSRLVPLLLGLWVAVAVVPRAVSATTT